mmetsp:Transcript_24625/g.51527  ORF Transcript_24625/g.51527 Transcript_24625/m.51527 type:complete len:97 (+) Transcript_24625:1297-1587(+)
MDVRGVSMAWCSGRCSRRRSRPSRPRRGEDAAEPKDVRGVAMRWCSGLLATLAASAPIPILGASASPPKEILGASIGLSGLGMACMARPSADMPSG